MQSEKNARRAEKRRNDPLYIRESREAAFAAAFPNGFDRLSDEIDAMKQYGLYCGTCGHGNGCKHGVPASRY